MSLPDLVRGSTQLRAPLMAAARLIFSLLQTGPGLLRRAVYDAIPTPYLVTGQSEKFIVSTADKVIGRELFLHGEFDFTKLQIALAIIEREGLPCPKHLIDVGANIGSIVIPALVRGLMQSATAIEPHPANLRLLRANLALNDVADRVRVLPHAVGAERNATLFLAESATNSGNHSIGSTGIPIPSSRLDDVEQERNDALLWMDIEGYEGHALKGADGLLALGFPVVCEYNPSHLTRSGGTLLLQTAFEGRRIYDLRNGISAEEASWNELADRYRGNLEFTDILAIP